MFLWEEHEFKKDANKGVGCVQLCVGDSPTRADGCFPPVSVDWFLALCACIGTCSAIGYGAFMLLVPFLHDGCNSSFRNGFAFSGRAVPTSLTRVPHGASVDSMLLCCPGVVNLLFSQATGFSNALKTSTSSNRYWDCAGAIAIVGIAAGVYILTQYVRHVWLMVRNDCCPS